MTLNNILQASLKKLRSYYEKDNSGFEKEIFIWGVYQPITIKITRLLKEFLNRWKTDIKI